MRFTNTNKLALIVYSCFFTSLSPSVWAQKPDVHPIQVEADQLDSQDATGITRYTGNVIISQGETQLRGDQVEIQHPNRQLHTMTITGSPALFKFHNPSQQTHITGHAQTIIYHTQQGQVQLIGEAYLEQENTHTIQGPKLVYDINNQTLNAGSTDQQTGRVIMTLTPQSDD
ncbi:lipopolysaccharide transport periplasmic protein LptA [Thiomicrospira microaerophila]|uniref:lipopolysaccharide transport periplasmic protein LptA n=1 Tax=Thiomicrospira microaerophila TaxID=406020 RepID=UPI000698AD03|nr:lipopolysaccharide transport periplasmic protein LptA [Thiomicrospira microaerophila]